MKSKNYEKLYKQLRKEKNPEKALKLADEIIKNRPYFRDPYLYLYKLDSAKEVLLKKFKKDKKCKNPVLKLCNSKMYERIVKENLENYLFSYWLNFKERGKDASGDKYFGEEGIICEYFDFYPAEDQWKFLKLLQILTESDIKNKQYLTGGDGSDSWINRTLQILRHHGEDDAKLKQAKLQALVYGGLKNYHGYLDIESAKGQFERALELDPGNAIANYGLGKYYFENEAATGYENVLVHLHKAEEGCIFIWDAYYYLGKIYVQKKDFERAKDYYKFALSLYDGTGLDELVDEMVEDLNLIGGCRQELLEAVDRELGQEEKILSPNIEVFKGSEHLLDNKTREGCESHIKSFKEELFDLLWDKLDNYSQQLILNAEKAYYCGTKSTEYFRPIFASGYLYYFDAIHNEILIKVFLPFKKEEWPKSSMEEKGLLTKMWFDSYKEKDKRKADNIRKLVQFLSDDEALKKKIDRPTLGQMLGMLSLDIKEYPVVKKMKAFVSYKSPLLVDDKFIEELDTINKERNGIHSIIDIEKSFVTHFHHFRDMIIGTKDKKGSLVRFLESVEMK